MARTHHSISPRCCDRLIRLAGQLLPLPRREDWEEEWRSELWHRRAVLQRQRRWTRAARLALCLRCLGALPHALWILWEEWMLDSLIKDVRFAGRSLRRRPGYSVAAVLTLGLGIGCVTALFSIVNAVLLDPLPYREPDRLVRVFETHPEWGDHSGSVTAATFFDWKALAGSFERFTAYQDGWELVAKLDGRAELLPATRIFPDVFSVLGMPAYLGRTFHPEERHPEDQNAVILSYDFWVTRFGADPAAVGRAIKIEGQSITIVGVMPQGFGFPSEDVAIWFSYNLSDESKLNRRSHVLQVLARVKPGTTPEEAGRELGAVMSNLRARYAGEMAGAGVRIVGLRQAMVGDIRPTLTLLLAAVTLLALVACVNVAGLGVVRSQARGHEAGIRSALGAASLRIKRMLLTESGLVALAAGAAGVALAHIVTPALLAAAPGTIPRAGSVGVDHRVFGFALAVTAVVALATGALPAWRLSRLGTSALIREGGRGSSESSRGVLDGLVLAQVTLSVALLVSAGLLVRTYGNLRGVDAGFRPERALTLRIEAPTAEYSTVEQQTALYDRVLERVEALPGVNVAGLITTLPLTERASTWSFLVEGRDDSEDASVRWDIASPGYFRAMEIPLVRGRSFDARDHAESPLVLMIDEMTANRFFPGTDPLGARVRMAPGGPLYTVVGVVGAVRHDRLSAQPQPAMYTSYPQNDEAWRGDMSLVVRGRGDPRSLLALLTGALEEVDSDLALHDAGSLWALVERSLRLEAFRAYLISAFALLTLVLAGVGLYGTLAYAMARRRREIAIRSALGARPSEIVTLVVRRGLTLVAIGAVVGAALSAAAARAVAGMLFEVSTVDAPTLGATLVVVGLAAAAASTIPAVRSLGVSPARALSDE